MADEPYPGDSATIEELAGLASAYRAAAHRLLETTQKAKAVARAPSRLLATHAIELYLSVYLLKSGVDAKQIRALGHDLVGRADLAKALGLTLRKRTEAHLREMSEGREYLVMRYAPSRAATVSQVNRLSATLEEISKKVERTENSDAGAKLSTAHLRPCSSPSSQAVKSAP